MTSWEESVDAIVSAKSWDARISLIRRLPEEYGVAQHQEVYAAVAQRVYVPRLAPDFAYVHWREEYELSAIESAYRHAHRLTDGFQRVSEAELAEVILGEPRTVRIFRLLIGFTPQEFAAATKMVVEGPDEKPLGAGAVKSLEEGGRCRPLAARRCAAVVDRVMRGALFEAPSGELRSKLDKPDTVRGWASVREYATNGVPFSVFLHQRHYGGAFRQLLDATSGKRGDVIEDAVEQILVDGRITFIRTGSQNQEEIATRFGLTVKPAPDFVVSDGAGALRALIECKGANDGGTARDKAARFRSLRAEAARLGGVPVFAVLAGLGWTRTADALGPVVRDTDGRVFTGATLGELMSVQPFPMLVGAADTRK